MADARRRGAGQPPRARLVAPARWVPEEVIAPFAEIVAAEGLDLEVDPLVHHRNHQLAGTDEERAVSLASALGDEEVDILWGVRGGYGTTRTLPLLPESPVSGAKLTLG